MTNELKIAILSDKSASGCCYAEHGLSYLVFADKPILFDTGASDLFLHNAKKMNINLDNVDTVVLSHGHYDHGNGLQYIEGKTIVTHPNAFVQRISERSGKNISVALSRSSIAQRNTIIETVDCYWLSQRVVFLGEIPRCVDFEQMGSATFHFTDGKPDIVIDDSGIAVITSRGLFVISGCAHAGICNTIEHARKVTGIDKVYAVMGGFHLTHNNARLQATIQYFKSIGVEVVMPAHCTSLEAQSQFFQHFRCVEVKTGMIIE